MKKFLSIVLLMLFLIPMLPADALSIRIGPGHRGYYHHRYPGRGYYYGPTRYYVYPRTRVYYERSAFVEADYAMIGQARVWDTDDEGDMTVIKLENGMVFRVYSGGDYGLRGNWAAVYQKRDGGYYKVIIDGRVLDAERLN